MKTVLLNIYYALTINIPYFFTECKIRLSNKNVIVINAFLNYYYGYFHKHNWGDDLNIFFIEELTGRRVVSYQASWISKIGKATNYMCIGSYLHNCTPETVVWGSGVLSTADDCETKKKPLKVLAVRGPLSRKYLMARGIDCPEVYGDPALLLPYIYHPELSEKKYKLGVVPHIHDMDSPEVKDLRNNAEVLIIDLNNYKNWHNIIEELCSCEMIISSSLHGLIVSDAYHIPNIWVQFSQESKRDSYKYFDYFKSVQRDTEAPYIVSGNTDLNKISQLIKLWKAPVIDLMPLIESCPFNNTKLKDAYNISRNTHI